jgi:hypothetical protein
MDELPQSTELIEDAVTPDFFAVFAASIDEKMREAEVGPYANPFKPELNEEADNPLSSVPGQPRSKIVKLLVDSLHEAGPPTKEFIEAAEDEARSLASFIGSKPHPLARGAATLPARKGNRRRGSLRAKNGQIAGKNAAAYEDPIILRRRAMAMPLWNRGETAGDIAAVINEWLVSEGLLPVSADTIRIDKVAILRQWEADYDSSSAMNRAQHISALNRMKNEAWGTYLILKSQERSTTAAAQFLKIAATIETDLSVLDGSKKRAEVQAVASGEADNESRITRVYLGADISDLGGEENGK